MSSASFLNKSKSKGGLVLYYGITATEAEGLHLYMFAYFGPWLGDQPLFSTRAYIRCAIFESGPIPVPKF